MSERCGRGQVDKNIADGYEVRVNNCDRGGIYGDRVGGYRFTSVSIVNI